jgi:hypothetical protein
MTRIQRSIHLQRFGFAFPGAICNMVVQSQTCLSVACEHHLRPEETYG